MDDNTRLRLAVRTILECRLERSTEFYNLIFRELLDRHPYASKLGLDSNSRVIEIDIDGAILTFLTETLADPIVDYYEAVSYYRRANSLVLWETNLNERLAMNVYKSLASFAITGSSVGFNFQNKMTEIRANLAEELQLVLIDHSNPRWQEAVKVAVAMAIPFNDRYVSSLIEAFGRGRVNKERKRWEKLKSFFRVYWSRDKPSKEQSVVSSLGSGRMRLLLKKWCCHDPGFLASIVECSPESDWASIALTTKLVTTEVIATILHSLVTAGLSKQFRTRIFLWLCQVEATVRRQPISPEIRAIPNDDVFLSMKSIDNSPVVKF